MKCRVKFLVQAYLWTVIVFVMAKVAFMLFCREGHEYTFGDMIQVLWHGCSLDLSTALYFLIVPFLLSIVSIWYWAQWLTRLLQGYFQLISLAFALAFVADTSMYPFWGIKLNASWLQYLNTPNEMAASVSTIYIIIRFLALAVTTIVIFGGYKNITTTFLPLKTKTLSFVAHLVAIPFIVIGIRGGLDESTTNIGQVYFSQNQYMNHSAVNPVFNFLYSLSHQVDNVSQYQFFNHPDEYKKLTQDIYTTESIGTDTLLTQTDPNIVVILLESCGEQFSKAMPELQRLKKEGIYFSNCYGNSWRTDRGTVCALSGYPSFPTLSVMKMPEKSAQLSGIADVLKDNGYETSFIYGGDINFTNMRSYLISTGWEHITWKEDYTAKEQRTAEWGVRDDITFQTLFNQLTSSDRQDGKSKPQLIGYLTLSSHEPWDVPIHKYDDEVENSFYYLDTCISSFINNLKKTPQWDNTLIIMLADHGINHADIDEQKPLLRNRIPMLWLGGVIKSPQTIETLCNQSDLCATLLGQLRLPHQAFRFSRDVLSKSYIHPTAVHNYSNAQLLIDSTGYILYDFDAKHFITSQSADKEKMLNINKAILQLTTEDLISIR